MKSKTVKYDEAVARNIITFFAGARTKTGDQLKAFAANTLESAKKRIGIRQTDTRHDNAISVALTEASNKTEKFVKKEKSEPAVAKTSEQENIDSQLAAQALKGPRAGYLGVNLKARRTKV